MDASINPQRVIDAIAFKKTSQRELAGKIGCTVGAINQITTGRTRNSTLLPAIARELGYDVDYFLDLTDDPFGHNRKIKLTSNEIMLISHWRQLEQAQRDALAAVIDTMVEKRTIHESRLPYKAEEQGKSNE